MEKDTSRGVAGIREALRTLSRDVADIYWTRVEHIGVPVDEAMFLRKFVVPGRPAVIHGLVDATRPDADSGVEDGAKTVPPVSDWTHETLSSVLGDGDTEFMVNVTPNGRGDAAVIDESGAWFVKPEERRMNYAAFAELLKDPSCVAYLSHQDSNLTEQFPGLASALPHALPLAAAAFGSEPDAVNLWVGDSRAVTTVHKDPYHNLYLVLSGEKTFTLLPPTDLPSLAPRPMRPARYAFAAPGDAAAGIEARSGDGTPMPVRGADGWYIVPEEDGPMVPWIELDPAEEVPEPPDETHAITVTVRAGEALYLPPLVFHRVAQGGDATNPTVAINFWHDMDYGPLWGMLRFVEQVDAAVERTTAESD